MLILKNLGNPAKLNIKKPKNLPIYPTNILKKFFQTFSVYTLKENTDGIIMHVLFCILCFLSNPCKVFFYIMQYSDSWRLTVVCWHSLELTFESQLSAFFLALHLVT